MNFDQVPEIDRGKIKTERKFSIWVENFIKDFYVKNLRESDFEENFHDPVGTKIDEIAGDGEHITSEMKDLTIIFGEKLISFCKNIIFDKDYNKEKVEKFYKNLYDTSFNRSPNIFENLNIDYIQKAIISSEINETYRLRDFVDISGEMAYDLSWDSENGIKKIAKDIEKLPESKKISVIKQLSNTAIRACGDGSWAYPALKNIVQLFEKELENPDNTPIVSFVADFELKRIKNFANNYYNFEEADDIEDYKEKFIYEDEKNIQMKVIKDNTLFSKNNKISPLLENTSYTNVSKDYGSIVSNTNLIPFALVKKLETKEGSDDIKNILPIKNYDGFTKEKEFNPFGDEDFSHLIKILHTPEIRSYINNRLKINIEDLALREQIYFLKFLSTSDKGNFAKLEKIIKDRTEAENNNFLRSFLSMSGSNEMGNKILELGEKLPKETAKIIFAKFGEIIDSVDEVMEVIRERFGKETNNPSTMDSIRDTLLKKGSDLLIECSKMASICNTEEECSQVGKIISERLENSKHSAILLGSAFKSVLKEGISLDKIKDVTLESTSEKRKLSAYKREMIRIFEENRIDYPKELLKETLSEFEEAIENPDNKEFFILKDKENIIAFMRFNKLPNGNLYAGSLNALNEIHGLAIGGALLKELLVNKSKNNNIEAVVYEKNPMLKKYLSDYGFKKTGEIENYKDTGQRFYKIEIEKESLNG